MQAASSIRLKEIAAFVADLTGRGMHAKQFGPEVVAKRQSTDAQAMVVVFGNSLAYLQTYDNPMTRVSAPAGELAQSVAEWLNGGRRGSEVPGTVVPESELNAAMQDVDALRQFFAPEISVEMVLSLARERGIPYRQQATDEITILRRSGAEELGTLILRNNLWYLRLPNQPPVRIDDHLILELVYELESLRDGEGAMEGLIDGYGARERAG